MAEDLIDLSSIRDNEEWCDPGSKTFKIMNDLLQPNSLTTPRKAAKEINDLYLVERTIQRDSGNSGRDPQSGRDEGFVWDFWMLLIGIVQVVPYDHSGQKKLLSTVENLSRLPPTDVRIWSVCVLPFHIP